MDLLFLGWFKNSPLMQLTVHCQQTAVSNCADLFKQNLGIAVIFLSTGTWFLFVHLFIYINIYILFKWKGMQDKMWFQQGTRLIQNRLLNIYWGVGGGKRAFNENWGEMRNFVAGFVKWPIQKVVFISMSGFSSCFVLSDIEAAHLQNMQASFQEQTHTNPSFFILFLPFCSSFLVSSFSYSLLLIFCSWSVHRVEDILVSGKLLMPPHIANLMFLFLYQILLCGFQSSIMFVYFVICSTVSCFLTCLYVST